MATANILADLYKPSLALLTDLYQLTMAYGYWRHRLHDREAVFHLFFREQPFGGGFTIAAGLATATEFLDRLHFDRDDLSYLATLTGSNGKPLFERAFLDYLGGLRLTCDMDGVPEGTVVFPHEPLLRVRGPLLQCQLVESALLNIINFQTLVATKAARVTLAARGEPVLEFGLRRAQGVDGALTASRAAYIGGVSATSNVLAGRLFGIPVRGTHAHSWVMCFDSEPEAFAAYAEALPHHAVFLVDTYDTLDGVRHAIAVGQKLRAGGHELLGIRLDSGDLAALSREARKLLDAAGFAQTTIIASNDLDEHLIANLKDHGAAVNVWGVGTKLITAYDQPALGGVYKLSAIRGTDGKWQYRMKLSEQPLKVSNPGVLQVRRFTRANEAVADMIYDAEQAPSGTVVIVDPLDPTRRQSVTTELQVADLLVPVCRGGRGTYRAPPLPAIRDRVQTQLALFPAGIKRLANPDLYPVGLEEKVHERKAALIRAARGPAT